MKVNHTIFRCVSRKFKFYLNLAGITGTLHEEQYTFMMISFSVLLRMKMSQTKLVENIKTHFMYNNFFFFQKNLPFMRLCGKNTVDPKGPR